MVKVNITCMIASNGFFLVRQFYNYKQSLKAVHLVQVWALRRNCDTARKRFWILHNYHRSALNDSSSQIFSHKQGVISFIDNWNAKNWRTIGQWVPRGKQYLFHCRLSPNCGYLSSWGGKYAAWRGESGKLFGFSVGGPTDKLRPFAKSSEIGLG